MELYKKWDNIHDPSIYDIDPNASTWVEVDTFVINFGDLEKEKTADAYEEHL